MSELEIFISWLRREKIEFRRKNVDGRVTIYVDMSLSSSRYTAITFLDGSFKKIESLSSHP